MESVYDVNQTMVKAYQESGYMRVKSVDDPQIGEAPADFYTENLKNSWQDQYNDAAVVMLTRQSAGSSSGRKRSFEYAERTERAGRI